jgi:signal transduction histidine kinase
MPESLKLSEFIPALILSGGALLMGIYHFLLYIQYREKIILRYSFYLFSIVLYTGFDIYLRSSQDNAGLYLHGIREAINFVAILCYASFLMEIARNWKSSFPLLFRAWDFLAAATIIYISGSVASVLIAGDDLVPVIESIATAFKLLFVAMGAWAAISIVPRAKGRFNRLIIGGAIGYLFFMAAVLAAFMTKDRELAGLSPIQWFYAGTFFEVVVFSFAMSVKVREVLDRLHALRTRLSRDLHDEIGATLTSISFLTEVARQPSRSVEERSRSLEMIGEYSREMITEMNDIVWAINPGNDRFTRITDRMKNFGQTLLAAKNISFHFEAADSLEEIKLNTQQRKNLYLVFKEAVNNAVKYSQCTQLFVDMELENSSVRMSIRDQGDGFNMNDHPAGNGMDNMKARASEIGGELSIHTARGKGTTVELLFPITQNA